MLSELGDQEVVIQLSDWSIGPLPYSQIESIGIGFDWDTGKIFLIPSKELVDKNFKK